MELVVDAAQLTFGSRRKKRDLTQELLVQTGLGLSKAKEPQVDCEVRKKDVYYFLAIYLKGLLQSLKLYAGHPSDLVKCTADFDVRYPRQFSRTGFSIAHLCRSVGSVDTPCGQQCAANGSR
ncbi:hypothetical protein ALC60_07688 [Trachymyrmex zeteki]|uniref:Uncharacterized protein n=1 Tax=Mycetomoellerius zeteki TaxID=64791 RepID=A0A151WYJ1_9HYME|nr:hypothetical protein ALC60_07688 [Trachymyrmex zeteki]